MTSNNLEKLMIEELKDLYDAEKQLTKALPKMASQAKTAELRQAFNEHLKQTEGQVRRLDSVFRDLKVTDKKKECKGMQALIQEGEEMAQQTDVNARDAALISAAQRVEHYEMAGYGTVISFALQLENTDVAEQLQQTLNEEKQADLLLSQIAEAKVNSKTSKR
jgi:ferritin-like metal-binding protein YciE